MEKKILLIDDEPEIVEEYARALKRERYLVDTAFSGEEGWEKYQRSYYEVVLLDWKMQKMNGMEVLKRIDGMNPFAKVIMITAFGDEQTAIESHHYHAFDYLKKPVDMDELVKKVAEAVQRKDGIINALEDWVSAHPEESSHPMKATLSGVAWSAKDVLDEIRGNTEFGRKEYQKLIQLTIDLLTRGKIQ